MSTMSPDMNTNGNVSASGSSLMNQSHYGNKSRVSAPVTIPAQKGILHGNYKDQMYAANVVHEVDDEDSKIISLNNSNQRIN